MARLRIPAPPPDCQRWTPAAMLGVAIRIPGALLRLLGARIRLLHIDPAGIDKRNRKTAQRAANQAANRRATDEYKAASTAMAGYLVPRVAHLVPWRSDCLVQAMAAQDWLARRGIAATIMIGIDRTSEEGFISHAWLQSGNQIVTGGVIGRYTAVLGGPAPPGFAETEGNPPVQTCFTTDEPRNFT